VKTPLIWIHCASLGEFEQGRPLIESLKKEYPAYGILLTFFSPSGFEVRKNYESADLVFYLPKDTPSNAKEFLEIVQPKIAVFVKYEFWLNFLNAMKSKNVPLFLISGIFRPDQHFFKWYGKSFKQSLHSYSHLFLQNEESLKLIQSLGIKNCSVAGDTRFDRVYELSLDPKRTESIEDYVSGNFAIVAGSTWQQDEELLIPAYFSLRKNNPQLRLIIAPHNVDEKNISELIHIIKNTSSNLSVIRYTQQKENFGNTDIVIIDTIGMLSSLYQYGKLAYVGGGFGSGIHNILEPMAFGLPVIFGPDHKKFHEAFEAISRRTGFDFSERAELDELLQKFISDQSYLKNISSVAKEYVKSRSGSTGKVMDLLKTYL
jgi:3-deoxy-D-manno-octulosonic-acid transferase